MAKDPKKKADDSFVELPEDRISQIDKEEPVEKKKEKKQGKRSAPAKEKQARSPKVVIPAKADEPKSSGDEMLLDVRQALIDESLEEAQKQTWFQRFSGRFKKSSGPTITGPVAEPVSDVEVLAEDLGEVIPEPKPKKKKPSRSKQEEVAIQEFFSDLEALADVDIEGSTAEALEAQAATELPEVQPEKEASATPPPVPHLPVKSEETVEVDFEEVRQLALEEYDGVAVEPEVKVPIQDQIRKGIRELRPFEKYALIGFGVLIVGALLFSGMFVLADSISASLAPPVPTPTIDLTNVIHPIQLSLPGGWVFDLGQGKVVDGRWMPERAEWLVGTEISRWVALPWSLQLEAVLRTLQPEDQITLTMSNFQALDFNVYSIQELTMEQIQTLDPNKPGLLIILFGGEGDTDTHWVVTAVQ